jgi:hypothetical protein
VNWSRTDYSKEHALQLLQLLLFSPLDSLPRMITPNLTRRAALQLSTVAATKYHSDNLEGQSTALTVSGMHLTMARLWIIRYEVRWRRRSN